MFGRIVNVEERNLGSTLAAALVGGETSLTVVDAADFNESGTLLIDAETLAYDALDEDTGVITLTTPVVSAHDEDADVLLYPLSVERIAYLIEGDDPEDEEGMLARVPHALYDKIPAGARDLDVGEGETVQAEFADDELVIVELTGQAPLVDGSYIDPDTLPATGGGSDGDPPSGSPTAVIEPAFGALAVSWSAVSNADPVTYDIYIDTTSSPASDPLNLVGSIQGTLVFLRTDATGAALLDATTYHVQIVARDADGEAAPGTEATGQIIPDSGATDGNPPASSPTPTVRGGIGILYATWSPVSNADPVAYEVHVSTVSGFTPDAGTHYVDTMGTSAVVRTLPSGSALAYGTTYYVKLVALDDDGSAAAGSEGSAALIQVGGGGGAGDIDPGTIQGADLEANTVTANEIAAATITANEIAAGTITAAEIISTDITADEADVRLITAKNIVSEGIVARHILAGAVTAEKLSSVLVLATKVIAGVEDAQRIELDPTGLHMYGSGTPPQLLVSLPTDTSSDPTFNGNVVTNSLTVRGNSDGNGLLMQGLYNVMDKGSRLTLNEKLANPGSGPTIAVGLDSVSLTFPLAAAGTPKGLDYDSGSGLTYSLWPNGAGNATYLAEHVRTSGALARPTLQLNSSTITEIAGCAVIGGYVYTLYQNNVGDWILKIVDLTTLTVNATINMGGSGSAIDQANLGGDGVAVGTDGTKLLICSHRSASITIPRLSIYSVTSTTATLDSTTNLTSGISKPFTTSANNPDTGTAFWIAGITGRGTDYMVTWCYSATTAGQGLLTQSFDKSTFTLVPTGNAFHPFDELGMFGFPGGVTYADGAPMWMDLGVLHSGSPLTWDYTGGNTWYYAFTWADATHETTPSGIQGRSLSAGIAAYPMQFVKVTLTMPVLPTNVTKHLLYAVNASAIPLKSALKYQASTTYVTSETDEAILVKSFNSGGAAPPITNNFDGATSTILSASASALFPWQIRGDGVFAVPTYQFSGRHSQVEIQTLTITGSPTGGTFTITFVTGSTSSTTAAINRNATAADVETALNLIQSIKNVGGVTCSGGPLPGSAVTITFVRPGNRNQMTTTDTLSGGTAPASAITTATDGTPVTGQLIFDETTLTLDVHNGTDWHYLPIDLMSLPGGRSQLLKGLEVSARQFSGTAGLLKAQSYPIESRIDAGSTMTNGSLRLIAVWWPGGIMTGMMLFQTVQGVYTDNGSAVGLYSFDGTTFTRLSTTAAAGTFKNVANAFYKKLFASGSGFPKYMAAGIYYVALLYSQSAVVTAPDLATQAAAGVLTNIWDDLNGDVNPSHWPLIATLAGQTSLPTSTTYAAVSTNPNNLAWCGLY